MERNSLNKEWKEVAFSQICKCFYFEKFIRIYLISFRDISKERTNIYAEKSLGMKYESDIDSENVVT